MNKKCTITIKSHENEKKYEVRAGLRLDAVAMKYDTSLEFSCKKANCGICIIKISKGSENISQVSSEEKKFLNAMKALKDERLACQCRVYGDIIIEDTLFGEY